MSSFKAFDIAGSGMAAQSVRLNTTASNLANADSVSSTAAGVYKPRPGWSVLLARIVFANAVMAALLIWLGGDIAGWLAASPLQRAARLAMCVAAGAVAYFAALFISGLRLRHMRSSGA